MDRESPQQDTLYQAYDKHLQKITGDTASDNIMNMIGAGQSPANNSQMVSVPSDTIGSGQGVGTVAQSTGGIESGKQAWSDTTAGYFLGIDTDGIAKLNIGSASKYIKWDGSTLTVVGGVSISSLDIPDTVTANSFHVDSSGNAWWGSILLANAVGKILNTGAATFSNMTITGGSVAGSTITANSISGSQIQSATITATNIANATITSTQIAAATITASNIASATITGTQIANATITGTQIAATTIAAGNIVSNTITATQIANNTITASQIANNTITATQIANATITTSQISGSAGITGAQIASATIAAANIVNNTLTATQIASNTITASQIANLTITAGQIANLTITSGKVNTALMSYNHNIVFLLDGSAPSTTVNWASGTITTSDGTPYSIVSGTTGVMAAKTFIYLDTGTSTTVLQKTTTLGTAVGDGKMLIAVAQNNTTESIFQVFNGIGGTNLAGSSIVAGSITANEIAASTITATQIASATITATQIAANTITGSNILTMNIAGKNATFDTGTIGGFTMSATQLTATNFSVTSGTSNVANLTVGTGSNLAGLNSANSGTDIAFWAGSTFANRATAPFRVNAQGDLVATSATISGYVVSGKGAFGGDGSDGALSTSSNLEDSYSESNQDSSDVLGTGSGIHADGQSFTASASMVLTSCKFYIKKTNSPTGVINAKLYSHQGTFGSTGTPNTLLATSEDVDVSTLSTSYGLITFTFSGVNQYPMVNGTHYFIVYTDYASSGSNVTSMGYDGSSPSAAGNAVRSTNESSWTAFSTWDLPFYVYGAVAIDLAGAQYVIKNYTSISITGTGKVIFQNPHANGSHVTLKSQGNITLTSSLTPMIDMSGMGAAADTNGYSYSIWKTFRGNSTAGAGVAGTGGAIGSINSTANIVRTFLANNYQFICPGAGGAGGGTNTGGNGGGGSLINAGSDANSGANTGSSGQGSGSAGGGVLIMECGGAWKFTTTSGISVAGLAGGNGTGGGNAGGGGGGGGGIFIALYNTLNNPLTDNTGTITISGGVGGTHLGSGGDGGPGGNGYSIVALNTFFA
jgi:hypothetical protein